MWPVVGGQQGTAGAQHVSSRTCTSVVESEVLYVLTLRAVYKRCNSSGVSRTCSWRDDAVLLPQRLCGSFQMNCGADGR